MTTCRRLTNLPQCVRRLFVIDVIVSGAEGFVGKHLTTALAATKSLSVRAMTRHDGDVAEQETWNALPPARQLVHLAARTFVPDSWEDRTGFIKTNVTGTAQALEYCVKHETTMLFMSSYLYGQPKRLPIDENSALQIINPYMMTKHLGENLCNFYAQAFGLRVVILRPFNIYGPGQGRQFLIPTIVQQMMRSGAVHVKDLEPRRDYVHVDDLVSAIRMAMHTDTKPNTYNIGSGVSHSVQNIIDETAHLLSTTPKVTSDGERRPNEVMDTVADIDRAQLELGWQPQVSLSDGIASIIREYQP